MRLRTGRYYTDAVAWASANGIVGGTSATTLSPADVSTRAQLATILMRFCADQTDI
ncbi:S-layer homology domain-containing protein [Candidatus Pseudoscillospira sp. SGI.172]|uniref:S-layer homology domain-containing protein n=1 Tax=Candidatus Pseudoscillospira sp. SGI.172 TaxID=3420582 RepID=UPI001179F1DC